MTCSTCETMKTINKGNAPLTHHTFTFDDGEIVDLSSISSGDITMYFFDQDRNAWEGQGTWTITSPGAGLADYLFSPNDTDTIGEVSFYPSLPLDGETVPRDFTPQTILITDYPKPS